MRTKKPKTHKYYVTMTDRFMSGWGKAQDKINKYVVECDTMEQAERIEQHALRRGEMKYVNVVVGRVPYYNPNRYYVSLKKYSDLGDVWKR